MSRRLAGGFAAVAAVLALAVAAPAHAAGLTLTVKAVPALDGLDFSFNGHRYTTPKSGVVTIPVPAPGTYPLVALPWQHTNRGLLVSFSRWSDDSFTTARTVTISSSRTLEVGYGVSYLRGLRFYDCIRKETDFKTVKNGCEDNLTRAVDPNRVSQAVLASSIGEKTVLRSTQRVWLEGSRVSRRLNGLEETFITYSVLHVRVEGSDVVNQAQQRFYLAPPSSKYQRRTLKYLRLAGRNLPIRLSLYDARFTTHDLLLRGSIGSAIELTYPNGRKRDVPLRHGEVTLKSLPRGLFHVMVKTGAGIQMRVPVSLSKNQNMQLKVISYADVGGSFLVFVLVSVGLVTARRPALRAAIRRRLARMRRNLRVGMAGR